MTNFTQPILKTNTVKHKLLKISLRIFPLFVALLFFSFGGYAQTVENFTVSGTSTWTVPAGVTSVTVECVGGGGGGGAAVVSGAGGGGGGAYAIAVLAVTTGQNISYTVGAGGVGGPLGGNGQIGIASTFGVGPVLVAAVGGDATAVDAPAGASGGLAGSCVGSTVYSGGNGGDMSLFFGLFPAGGGGGGGAGTGGAGSNGVTTTPGAGNPPGGIGGDASGIGAGMPGATFGGGGSGAGSGFAGAAAGGTGANGLVRITYTVVSCAGDTQASAVSVPAVTETTASFNWTTGGGTGDIVVLKASSAVDTNPTDGVDYSAVANPAFGTPASEIGSGNFIVHNGGGVVVAITNLIAGVTYYYAIYSFDALGSCYLLPAATGSFQTVIPCTPPTTQTSLATVACVESNSIDLSFTRGNGTRAIVLAKAVTAVDAEPLYNNTYTADAAFGIGSQIGIGNFVVYDGDISGIVTLMVTNLLPGTMYYFEAFEYDEAPNCYNTTSPASISQMTTGGEYFSSTVVQNTANVFGNDLAADMIKLKITTNKGVNQAVTINNIIFSTNGSTAPISDIVNAKIFYTGSVDAFSDDTQYGTTFTSFAGNLTATDNFALLDGDNFFWIAYDVLIGALEGDVLDAEIISINITDYNGTADYTPSDAAPIGNRPLPVGTCPIAQPVSSAPFGGCSTSTSQGDRINNISFGTTIGVHDYSFSSSCAPAVSYYDKTATNVFEVLESSTYTFSNTMIEALGIIDYQYAVWIDWNGNGDFRDAGERYPSGTGVLGEGVTLDITIPVAVAGGVAMRLWVQSDTYPPDDCPYRANFGALSLDLGQVMDVTLNVTNGTGVVGVIATGSVSCATVIPTVTTPISYAYEETAVALTATGTTVLWYADATGGTGSVTAPTPTTTASGTTMYYVSQNNGTCEGPRTQIAVNVNAPVHPTAPLVEVVQAGCSSIGDIILTGLPTPGTWTVNPAPVISSGTTTTLSGLAVGTYNYTVTDSRGCISPLSLDAVISPSAAGTMTGTKLIDPDGGGDYVSFTTAIADLNFQGVAGPVVFEAIDAVYTEQLTLGPVCDASLVNTITFKTYCDICAVAEIQATGVVADNYTLKIDGGEFYILDRIKFTALDASFSRVVDLTNGANNIEFKSSIFQGQTTVGNSNDNILVFSDAQTISDIVFTANTFTNGSQSLYLKGDDAATLITGITLTGNAFSNPSYRGISIINADAVSVSGNELKTTGSRVDFSGFYLQTVKNASQIDNNQIYATAANGNGIFLDNFLGTVARPANVFNNMVSIGTGANTSFGIDIVSTTGPSEYINFYFNSINNIATIGSAFRVNTANNLDIKNDIFSSASASSYSATALTVSTEDYNSFTITYAGIGANSIINSPVYVSSADLHIEDVVTVTALNDKGINIPAITTDIDGETRQVLPFIGSDEYLGLVSWTGATDADWNNIGNWDSGQIPTVGTTVSIPAVATLPSLNSDASGEATARNLMIEATATLTVPASKYLTVDKSFINDGIFIIESDASGTGSFIPNGTVAGTGTNTIKQHVTPNKWHYMGSPLTAASGVFTGGFYYKWDETVKDRWLQQDFVDWATGITPTTTVMGWDYATDPMTPGAGIIFYHETAAYEVGFTGTFNNGDIPINLVYTDQGGDATQDIFDGWNLIANPYPSSVNWNSEGIVKSAEVDNAIYIFEDAGAGAYNNYKYYLKGSSASPYPSISLNASTNFCFLPPMQAAFVRANTTGGTVTFKNTARAHTATQFYGPIEIHPNMLKLAAETAGYEDETIVRFIPESETGYDGNFDAIKRFSTATEVPQLYSVIPATGLAVNSLPQLEDNSTVQLGFRSGIQGQAAILVKSLEFAGGGAIYLIDKLLRRTIDLRLVNRYDFFTEIGTFENRFELIFEARQALNVFSPQQTAIFAYAAGQNVYINVSETLIGADISFYNAVGMLVFTGKAQQKQNIFNLNVASGNYIIKVQSQNQISTSKLHIGE